MTRTLPLILLLFTATGPRPAAAESAEKKTPTVEALSIKQQMVRDRIARLEDHMFRLREKLAETEPENARRLGAALEQVGALDVSTRMARLAKALESTGQLDQSLGEQDKLLTDLETVLAVLLDRDPNDARRREELRRLAAIKQDLDRLLQEQNEARRQTARQVLTKRLARKVAEAKQQLQRLESEQQDLARRSRESAPGDQGQSQTQAGEQAQLAQRAERLQRELERLARRHAQLRAMSEPSSEDGEASDSEDAQNPSGERSDASAPTDESDSEEPSPGQPQAKADDPGQSGESKDGALQRASEDMDAAADDMQSAAESRKGDDAESTREQQEEALEKIARAIHRLEEAQEELGAQSEQDQPGTGQRKLAENAGKLSRQMGGSSGKSQDQPSPSGESEQGQSDPSAPSDQQQPTPGQENVERAEQHMRDAAERLEDKKPEDAVREQDQAIDELERAQRELEEKLKQLRLEEKEEILASLESRLAKMLAEQTRINQATTPLKELGAENFTRGERLVCAELAEQQAQLAEAAGTGVRLLEEDGTTVVFPSVMRQLADDMNRIAARLEQAQVDALTVAMQDGVREALAELLESLKKLREEAQKQKQNQGGGGGGSGDAPLVPTSAELKLLRSSQLRVNRQTAAAQEVADTAQAEDVLQRTARQQSELVELALEIQQRAEKGMGPR